MHVEKCSQALLINTLPRIDKSRNGICIEVGVGTFAFYCELFARTGFPAVAVEPLPAKKLINICQLFNIRLIRACVSDKDGMDSLYIGTFKGSENVNLSSLRSDWWGASSKSIEVPTITVNMLLKEVNVGSITCLKLDIEGMEPVVIKQLQDISPSQLPSIVMFEYGGGAARQTNQSGWSEVYLKGSVECFRILKRLNYKQAIMVDSSPQSKEQIINLNKVDISSESLFQPFSNYGNVICFQKIVTTESEIERICVPFRDNDTQPPRLLPPLTRLERWRWRLRSTVQRLLR